jgi:hypothetical protein
VVSYAEPPKDYRTESTLEIPRHVVIAANFLWTCPPDSMVGETGAGQAIRVVYQWIQSQPHEQVKRGKHE